MGKSWKRIKRIKDAKKAAAEAQAKIKAEQKRLAQEAKEKESRR